MKKTLTVNLGGTVFHIDEDAYRLLDNYLSNLKIHFRKEAGADEIIDDIERRISELFTEKLAAGSQVITIAYVEEVIARMGKPEELEPDAGDAGSGSGSWDGSNYYGGMNENLVSITDLADFCAEGTKEKVEEAKKQILSGENGVFDGVIETNTGETVGKEGTTLDDATITGGINWYFKTVSAVE